MWWKALGVGLQLLAGFCSGVTVTQKEQFKFARKGAKASMECSHNDSTYTTILWYRQESNHADKRLELIGYSVHGSVSMEPNMEKYSIESTNATHASLSITPEQMTDSAVYFCAASKGEPLSFGQGTRLTVLGVDQDVSPPQVTIFAPPKQEVDEKEKATIVCLVTDFFPDHVALSWTVNNEKRTAGVKTEDPVYDKTTKRYSMTSRLRITKEEWQNADNKFLCRVSFHGTEGSTDYEDDINGADCGGGSEAARESYLTEAYLGELVYILLILKSTLYGAFVMGLKLRKKLAP